MRFLFIFDIKKEGVRIPFTDKYIPIPLVATALISIFGAPSVSASVSTRRGCVMPTGSYNGSCTDVVIKKHFSSDRFVPPTCELTAVCPTMFTGLPPVNNRVFIPADVELEDVTNNNGTLSHGGKALAGGVAKAKATQFYGMDAVNDVAQPTLLRDSNPCLSPQGSFNLTCEVVMTPYVSTDPKLGSTDFCKITAKCKTLEGENTTNHIYLNIQSQASSGNSIQKFENCDGVLVEALKDNRCQIFNTTQIKQIAKENGGSSNLVLGRR